jgi:16S rRNA (cytosine1402-N4)-methyltransferase
VLATDADAEAVERVSQRLGKDAAGVRSGRLTLRQCWLDECPRLARALGFAPLDGVLIDLGLSSYQLDEAARGFAFSREGPLDMRFDRSRGMPAAELIEQSDVTELTRILRQYGEVQNARRVAEAIWAARPIVTTQQLRDVVDSVVRGRSNLRIHPATQVFQAFRIAVNDELRRLSDALPELIGLLKQGGCIAVITFHSLEDRIVKNIFRDEARSIDVQPGFGMDQGHRVARVRLVNKNPITPAAEEIAANPRARSAKLRVAERL